MTMQDEQPTCGKGLAAHAALPEQIGTLMEAIAKVLQNHTRSLDLGDANSRSEREAYEHVVEQQRAVASSLGTLAATMRSYRDLPMGTHDERTLADRESLDVFNSFVRAEEMLLASLQTFVSEHRAMLNALAGK
jgi:hypothetical protein